MVSVSKFGIDTTKNPWYRIDLKKLVSPIPSLRKVGFRKSLISSTVAPEKDLTDTFCRPVDSSQSLTYFIMESPATTTDVFAFDCC